MRRNCNPATPGERGTYKVFISGGARIGGNRAARREDANLPRRRKVLSNAIARPDPPPSVDGTTCGGVRR